MGIDKAKAIHTTQSLVDLVQGAGLLCITIGRGDYIAIGASTFVGLRKNKGNQAGISIIAPRDIKIQRFVFKDEECE